MVVCQDKNSISGDLFYQEPPTHTDRHILYWGKGLAIKLPIIGDLVNPVPLAGATGQAPVPSPGATPVPFSEAMGRAGQACKLMTLLKMLIVILRRYTMEDEPFLCCTLEGMLVRQYVWRACLPDIGQIRQ